MCTSAKYNLFPEVFSFPTYSSGRRACYGWVDENSWLSVLAQPVGCAIPCRDRFGNC